MKTLLEQIKDRRKRLGFKQKDMKMRVGMSPQQYQRLEAKGNPRLDTLELIAKGLNGQLLFVPQEKLVAVKSLLEGEKVGFGLGADQHETPVSDDPWKGFFEED